MEPEKEPKKEQIKVDKDFLDLMAKTVTELRKEVDALKKPTTEVKLGPLANKEDYIFQSNVIAPYNISPEQVPEFQAKAAAFQEELKQLMIRHNFVQCNALFLKKTIQ